VGNIAKTSQPIIKQLIIAKADSIDTPAFERALFVIRKHVSHNIRTDASLSQALLFYVCSLSTTVIIYKGMLMGSQVLNFYTDLSDPEYSTYLAMVHSRFSTETSVSMTGNVLAKSSLNKSLSSTPSLACIQLKLPWRVLISPLCDI
jgi:glutamate synthase (NADPH/NADH) large chain